MPAGRPTKLTDDLLLEARKYLDEVTPFTHPFVPTIEGLALALRVSRETVYDWESTNAHPEFSDIVKELRSVQANKVIQKSINNQYNPMISKLLLSKHNYVEKKEQDITSGGEKMEGLVVVKNNDDSSLRVAD